MRLTPSDQDKLLLSVAGMVARDRLARGVALNVPEATALLCCWVLERARDGDATVQQLMADGREVLAREQVMEGVPVLLSEVHARRSSSSARAAVAMREMFRPAARDRAIRSSATVMLTLAMRMGYTLV